MSVQHPLTTGEKDAASRAAKVPLDEVVEAVQRLREVEISLRDQAQGEHAAWSTTCDKIERVQHEIEALKHRLASEL